MFEFAAAADSLKSLSSEQLFALVALAVLWFAGCVIAMICRLMKDLRRG